MVMDINALLDFIETHCEKVCSAVDLNSVQHGHSRGRPLRLLFDAEQCQVFFYGGQAGDWVSGGQWNNMVRYLRDFIQACGRGNILVTVFFNGVSACERYNQWCENQVYCSRHIQDIIRLIRTKAFHPPKALWVAPCGLTSVLRLALNHLSVPTAGSYRDHHLEIMSFARENGFDGIVSWDADLLMFDAPSRYFSARKLFLSYSGTLSTVEVNMDDFARSVDLHPSRFCILATLLGNHIMPAAELQEFYSRICHLSSSVHVAQFPSGEKIRAIITFLRKLPSVDDLNEVAREVFGCGYGAAQATEHFKKSVEYYRKGKEAGLSLNSSSSLSSESLDSYSSPRAPLSDAFLKLDRSRIPGDGVEEMKLAYAQSNSLNLITSTGMMLPRPLPHHHSAPPAQTLFGGWDEDLGSIYTTEPQLKGSSGKVTTQFQGLVDYTTLFGMGGYANHSLGCISSTSSSSLHPLSSPLRKWWKVAPEILKIAQERHRKAMMMPWVYQILIHGEIFLPPLLEDDTDTTLVRATDLFLPLRQRVYSVLLERDSESISDSDAVVREWSILHAPSIPSLPPFRLVQVPAPTSAQALLRMWFGSSQDDIVLRMHSFLDCFGCLPIQHLLLDQTSIKPQFLILCCVLRYLVIQKSVLIADQSVVQGFLATAVSNHLHNPQAIRELNIPIMSMHVIQLATIFMHGFETALFTNEAFGSPLPVDLFCPSQYFDGKLFHYKMAKISQNASLSELCENSLEQQMYLERMQKAILHLLPKDCACSRPFLWSSPAMQGPGPETGPEVGLPPRVMGPLGKFTGRRGNQSNSHPFSREIVCQPAGASGIPFPHEQHYLAVPDAPPSRTMRADSRTRHSRGRQRNATNKKGKVTSNEEPVQRESRPGRGAIRFRSHRMASNVAAPGFGRGRGCTVEMAIPDCVETPPVALGLEASVERWIGRGRGLSFRTSDATVGQQQQQQQQKVLALTSLPLEGTTHSQFSHLRSDLQQTDALTQFSDADGDSLTKNEHETGIEVQERSRINVTNTESPSDDVFLSMPPLMPKSDTVDTGVRWSQMVEAEELSLSQLTLEGNESEFVLPLNEVLQ